MLTRDRVKAASQGEPSLLVLNINASLSAVGDDIEVYAIPLELRRGGLLFAIPHDALSDQAIADGQSSAEDALIGPSSIFLLLYLRNLRICCPPLHLELRHPFWLSICMMTFCQPVESMIR